MDANSTTPTHPIIKAKIPEWVEYFGNPSSLHQKGRESSSQIEKSRSSILKNLNLEDYKLVFTSSGSESNHLAFEFLFQRKIRSKEKVFLSAIEHPCIEKQSQKLSFYGYEVIQIPVLPNGVVDLEYLENHIDENTVLCAVMAANNETGVVQDVEKVSEICKNVGVYFHCDTTQIPGKYLMDYSKVDADSFSFSAHKLYGLKGIGGLVYRTKPFPMIKGGLQEKELRAGTENILGILSFSKAFEIISNESHLRIHEIEKLRNKLELELRNLGVEIVALSSKRLSNTICAIFPQRKNDEIVNFFDKEGIAISKGAACHSGVWEPSPILIAMGISKEAADSAVRISLTWFQTIEETERFVEVCKKLLSR
jgi:cysteine desulfurase